MSLRSLGSFVASLASWGVALTACGVAFAVTACAAVYPELQTPVRSVEGREIEPPPGELRWLAFKGATVPSETRDGRKWGGDLGRGMPDPYAVLYVNGKVLLKTPVQGGTLAPTWPNAPAGNFWIHRKDRIRVELWDSSTISDRPIGIKELGSLDDGSESGEADVEFDSGARLRIACEPAHAQMGLGFYYELRIGEVYVTRVFEQSPAGRAGIKPGDRLMVLEDKPVSSLKTAEVQSILNTPHLKGLPVRVLHRSDGQEGAAVLKEGAIYPLFSEMGTLR